MSRLYELIQDQDRLRNRIVQRKYNLFLLLNELYEDRTIACDASKFDGIIHEILSRDIDIVEEQKRRNKK